MTIAEAIRHLAAGSTEIYCKTCTVDAVDEQARTVDCTPLDDSAPLLGVTLQAQQACEEGLTVFPTVGSCVVVGFLSPAVAVVLLAEQVEKLALKIGDMRAEMTADGIDAAVRETTLKITSEGVEINGGKLGGVVKIEQLTQAINALITAFNSHTHELPTGAVAVAGSATAQTNLAPVVVPAITRGHPTLAKAEYEDEKVKH